MRASLELSMIAGLATLLSIPSVGVAQGPRREARGPASAGAYDRLYDPAKVQKLSGEVTEVRKLTAIRGTVVITVKTEGGEELVHLGPAWYVDHQRTRVAKGDRVEVEGARASFGGAPIVLAASVHKGSQVLQLRDEGGFPLWAGPRHARTPVR